MIRGNSEMQCQERKGSREGESDTFIHHPRWYLVSPVQYVHLRVVQLWIPEGIPLPVLLPQEATHPRTPLGAELTVEYHHLTWKG